MRFAAAILVAAVGLIQPARPDTVPVRIHPDSGAHLTLYVEKTGMLSGKKHEFAFERFDGTVDFDEHTPAASRVSLNIDSASIVCRDTWVSAKDLPKVQKAALEDMLAAKRYPTISFTSTRIVQLAPGRFQLDGNLSIREITKPVSVFVDRAVPERFTGKAIVKLTDYGLKPPSAALGLIGTRDEMTFTFDVPIRPEKKSTSQ